MSLDTLARAARSAGGRWVSPGPVAVGEDARLGYRSGVLLRDPDGHAVLLSAP
ncbi:MAG: hypothetical protein ABI639_03850 [Thermoanaerobaculia bacterium]